jgi:orotate phosphoribosyltransferase
MDDGIIEPALGEFLSLVHGRRGHFLLESGYHAGLWLELDGLFGRPGQIAPFVTRLSARLAGYQPDLVCGPLLGGALLAHSVATALDTEFCFTQPGPPRNGDGLYRAQYRLPAAFRSRVRQRRVAIVDDVMSAGSSLRATCAELQACEAIPVAVGALLALGEVGTRYFAEAQRLPVEAVIRDTFEHWLPSECPLCAQGVPLESRLPDPAPSALPSAQ